jgi:hypothetical protein
MFGESIGVFLKNQGYDTTLAKTNKKNYIGPRSDQLSFGFNKRPARHYLARLFY